MEKTCSKCGRYEDFRIEERGGQLCCWCSCGKYMGNLPRNEYNDTEYDPIFPFKKYKGILLSEIRDRDYLSWVLKNVEMKEKLSTAIYNRIQKLDL